MNLNSYVLIPVCALVLSPHAAATQEALRVESGIRRAIETHPAVRASAERVRAARGTLSTARRWTNPVLTYEVQTAAMPGRFGPAGLEREIDAFATLPLEPLYQIWPRAAQAGAEVRAAEADLRVARREIALETTRAFYAVGSAQVGVGVLVEVRAWLDSLVEYTRTRVREGAAAEVDLIRLEVELGRTETDLAMARVDLARSRAQLASFLGTDAFSIDTSAAIDSSVTGLPPLGALASLAKTRRPEIQAADARLAAARSAVSLERASIVRELGVKGGVKSTGGVRALIAGITMPLPLFDQNSGGTQRAAALRQVAVFDRDRVERQITADLAAAYAAVETLSRQLSRMREGGGLLGRADESRRIAEAAYREGATSLVQVLDAARARAEAINVYYRALFARQQSLVELNAAIGIDDPAELLAVPAVSRSTPARDAREGRGAQ